jgi:hypothetical protein
MYFHFLSGRCQTFVGIRIWIAPWYAANLAFKKKALPSFYEAKKLVPGHYYTYGGTINSNGYLDLC